MHLIFYSGKGEFVTETPVGGDEPSNGGHVRIYPDISDVQEDSGPDISIELDGDNQARL